MDRNASIQADATGQGDGGTVVVWADDVTRYGGSISAKGGAQGGDGGFVEVSGKRSMVFAGSVDTTAANGKAGSLLLDPLNIIVDGSGADDPELIDGTVAFADRAGDTLRLSGSALEFVGGNVLLQATNDITINQYVELFTFGSKLTLDAGNDILVNAPLWLNGGDFVATAGRDLKVNAGLVTMGGDFIAKAGRDIQLSGLLSTMGGDVTATAGNNVVVNGALSADSGLVHLRANSAGMPAGPSGTGSVTVGTASPIHARQVHLSSGTSSATSAIDGSITATESVTFSDIRANLKSVVSAPTVDIFGNVTLGASQRISDGATLVVQASGSLDLGGFDETVAATFLGGTVTGTGSLSALTHTLGGGTVSATLAGGRATQSLGNTTLSGANTYTGGTAVNGGSLSLAHGAAAGTGGIDLLSGTLNINGGANVANNVRYVSGTIGNTAGAGTLSGNVALDGPSARFSSTGSGTGLKVSGRIDDGPWGYSVATIGDITFSGANTYDGGTSVTGSLTLTNASAAGAGTIVADGHTVVIDGVTINNWVRFAGGGTLRGRNAAGLSGGLFTSALKVHLDAPTAADTLTLSGLSTGDSPVAITGAGEVVLAGPSSRTGTTSVDNGTLTVAHSGGAGFGEIAVHGNTLNIDFNADVQNIVSVTTGTIGNTRYGGTLSGVLNLKGDAQLSSGGLGYGLTVIGTIVETGGARKLAKTGSGIVKLWGSNTWSGGTDVDGGTLFAYSALGAGDVLVRSGGGLALRGAQYIADNAAVVVDGTLNLGGAETIGSLAGNGAVMLGTGTLTAGDASNTSFGGVIGGSGGLVKRGTGTLALTGANTYTGSTTIGGGVLEAATVADAGTASSLGSNGSVVLDGGTLRYTHTGLQSTNRSFLLADGKTSTIEVGSNTGNLTLAAGLGGATGALAKTGNGTLTLAGANTYSGGTTVSAGNLTVRNNVLGGGNVSIASGAVLQYDNQTAGPLMLKGGTYSGTGTLRFTGNAGADTAFGGAGGMVNVALGSGGLVDVQSGTVRGSSTWQANWSANEADLTIGAGATFNGVEGTIRVNALNGAGRLEGGWSGQGSLTVGVAGGSGTFSGVVADSTSALHLVKEGAGTQVLSGANTFTGTTTVNAGTLRLSGGQAIADTASVTVGAGATLDVAASETIGTLNTAGTVSGTGTLSAGAYNLSGGTIDAQLGSGGITHLASTVVNKAVGATGIYITGGTLTTGGADLLSDTVAVTLAGSGTLALGGDEMIGSLASTWSMSSVNLNAHRLVVGGLNINTNFAGVISGSGGLSKVGTGSLTLSGVNTYTGSTSIGPGGRLILAATNAIAQSSGVQNNGDASTGLGIQVSNTLKALSGTGGTVLSGASTLTIGDADNQSSAYAGAISGTGSLLKAGKGSLELLAGTSSYSGSTTVNDGTLKLSGTLASTAISVGAGGTLELGANHLLADTATVSLNGGSLNMGAFSDTIQILNTNGSASKLDGVGTLTATTYNLGGGAIQANLGAGTLYQAGSTTTTLHGTAAAEAINVLSGTLQLGNTADRLTGAVGISINGGATLDTGTAAQRIGAGGSADINNGGTLVTGNAISLNQIAGTGAARIGGDVTTALGQGWGGNVTLTNTSTLKANAGGIQFSGAVDGAHGLTVEAAGNTVFMGAVGGSTALTRLTTTGGGTTYLGGNVSTTGAQTYDDAVVLQGNVTAASTGAADIRFAGSVDALGAGRSLAVNTAGNTVFDGPVGSTAALGSLTTDAGGSTRLGANVSTAGAQAYGDAVVLSGARTLTGSSVGFAGGVQGDGTGNGADSLAVNGAAAFGGTVGDATNVLAAVSVSGSATLGGTVTTTGKQSYGGIVDVAADTVIDAGSGDIAFASSIVGRGNDLTIRNSGALTFGSGIGNLMNLTIVGAPAVALPGTWLSGALDVTAGSLTQGGALTAATVRASTVDGVILDNAGNSIGSLGAISGATVAVTSTGGLAVTGPVSASGTGMVRLETTGGNLQLQGAVTTGSGSITATARDGAIIQTGAGRFATSGQLVTVSRGGQALVGANSVGAFGAANGGGGTIRLANTAATLAVLEVNQADGGDVDISNDGNLSTGALQNIDLGGNGSVTLSSTGALSLGGSVAVTGTGDITLSAGSDVALGDSVTAAGGSLRVNFGQAGAGSRFSTTAGIGAAPGGTVTITGGGGNDRFDLGSAGAITAGTVTLAGAGGSDMLVGRNAGTAFTISGADSGSTADGLTFSAIENLTGGSGSDSFRLAAMGSLSGAVDGGAGADTLDVSERVATVNAAAGTVAGLAGGFAGIETIVGGDATTLAGSAFNLTGADSGTVDGINYSGAGHLLGVGATNAFTGAGGSIQGTITGAAVPTTLSGTLASGGAQTYGGAVTLAAATTVASTGGAAVSFNGTVAGPHALVVNTSGASSFGGAVNLASLGTDAGGSTVLNGGAVTTSGVQSYGDDVTLGADTTLAGVGIRFEGSLNSAAATNRSLTVNDSGTTVFGGAVGTSQRLSSITTDAAGTTRFNTGADTRTTGDQTYNDAVQISGWRNFDSSGASTLRFASTVDGVTAGADSFVTVGTASTTRLDGAVGGTTAFSGVAFESGSILLNGGSVTTSNPLGGHTYGGAVKLGAHTTLSATGGSINFHGAVDGAFSLSANTSGVTDFRGAVGAVQALTGLTTDAGGSTVLAGGDVNAASQTYYDAVSIGGGRTLVGAVTFGSTVDGSSGAGGDSLTVTGNATFNGKVGGNRVLDHVSVGGTSAIQADVTTSGGQTYAGAVTLEGARTLAGTTVAFGSTVDGTAGGTADRLLVAGDARFGGAAGAMAALDSVTVVGAATLGGDVTTTGDQSYGSTALAANSTLSANAGAGTIATGAVSGGGKDLTLTGNATIGAADAVGALTANQALTTTGAIRAGSVTVAGAATLGGDVTTTDNQSYGSTALAVSSTLSANAGAGTIATGAVTGGGKDLTLTGNATIGATDAVGALTANQALTTTGAISAGSVTVAGAATLGGDVTTTGDQSYGSTALTANTALSANAGAGTIATGAVTGGGQDLTLTGNATIGATDAVGALTANQSLATTGAVDAGSVTVVGAATLGGDVTTTGNQSYGSTALAANSTLSANAGAGTIATGALIGGGRDLTLSGLATIGATDAVGALAANQALTTTGAISAGSVTVAGAATLGGNVTTAGAQSYQDAAVLAGATTLTSTGNGGIGFATGLTGGGNDLTIVSSGTTFLANATGIGTFTAGTGGTTGGAIVAAVYNLNGGTVNANLGAGTLNQAGGSSTLNGTSGAATVNVNAGTLQLGNVAHRLVGATTVAIAGGATLNTGTAAQALGKAAITNSGTLTTGGALEAASIASAGAAGFGGNVRTAGAQSYTGTLSTAANVTLEAGGSLIAGNATIGDGTTLRLNGAGTVDVAGDYAGAVKVDGGATSVTLTDASAATPFVVSQMTVAPSANVRLNSAGPLMVDAANFSPVARLDVRVAQGDAMFLNSSAMRGGQSGVLAAGGVTLQVDEGNVNTEADPMWINPATPNLSVTIGDAFKAWLAGNVSSDAVTRRVLATAQDGVGASRAEMVREFLRELKRNAGVGAVEDLVLSGGIDMEGITAPLNFSNLAVKLPTCAGEQANLQQCN